MRGHQIRPQIIKPALHVLNFLRDKKSTTFDLSLVVAIKYSVAGWTVKKIRKGYFYVLDIRNLVRKERRKEKGLIALAVALDGDGIELGLGEHSNLGVDVESEKLKQVFFLEFKEVWNLLAVHDDLRWGNADLFFTWHYFRRNLVC